MGKISGIGRVWRWLGRYGRDRRGNISAMVALLIVPLVGVMGVATETGNWFLIQRSMQNAADSAVLAAGQNGNTATNGSLPSYQAEARSVAANFGFTDSVNSTTVTPVNNQTCPAPLSGSNCYMVTITRNVPVNITRIVGYTGTGGGMQSISARAIAGPISVITEYCILALGSSGTGIRINGGPNVNLGGCNIASNSTGTSNPNPATNCNGQILGAQTVYAVGYADPACGTSAHSGSGSVSDPYASVAGANPSDLTDTTCGGVFTGGNLSSVASGGTQKLCGPQKLTSDITITSNTVLVIQNGQLDMNSHTISTTGTAGLTLVFNTLPGGSNIAPFASSTGTLNFAAPTSGNWSGVAIYQNRQNGSTAVVSQTYDGNKPTWDITGLVYLPYIDLTFKGIVNKSSNGFTCFALIANNLLVSGNGAIYANPTSECVKAGLTLPSNTVSTRITLVQ